MVHTSVPADLWAFDSEYWGPVGYYMGVLTHPRSQDRNGEPTYTIFATAAEARAYFQDPACPIRHMALASPRADFEAWSNKAAGMVGWYYPADIQIWNTTALHWLEDENDDHKLDDTCLKFLGYKMRKPIHMVNGEPWFLHLDGRDTLLWEADQAEVLEYCKIDSSKTRDCVRPIYDRLTKVEKDWYWNTEAEIDRIVFEMRARGVEMDLEALAAATEIGLAERAEREQAVYDALGYKLNLNSGDQLAVVLYEDEFVTYERGAIGLYKNGNVKYGKIPVRHPGLGLTPPGGRRTKSGKRYATDAFALEMLAGAHPVVDRLLAFAEVNKIVGTYLLGYPRFMTGSRLRGRFNPIGPVTGRYSSSEPNLQNQAKKGKWGKVLRNLFIAAPGKLLVVADQSQVEMRIAAAFSGCVPLIDAFASGVDIHNVNAALAGQPDDRDLGKLVGYGVVYGIGPASLGRKIGKSKEWTEAMLDEYFAAAPELDPWMDSVVEMADRRGYVRTISGRKRRLPGLYSHKKTERWSAERQAVNSVVQGSAADIVKRWQIECRHLPQILVVHDELVLEIEEERAEWACQELIDGLARAMDTLAPGGLGVEIIAEPSICKRWGDKA